MDENDPLYHDLYEGYLTGNSSGAGVLWDWAIGAVLVVVYLPLWMIVQTVKWFRSGRP